VYISKSAVDWFILVYVVIGINTINVHAPTCAIMHYNNFFYIRQNFPLELVGKWSTSFEIKSIHRALSKIKGFLS